MSAIISQREARRLKKRVAELEQREADRNSRWASTYPGGVNIGTERFSEANYAAVCTARALGHAVVLRETGKDGNVSIYGVRL